MEPIWSIGDVLCVKAKAEKGILEKVAIKRIIENTYPLYVDTFNTLWNEDELITQEDAAEIIAAL